MKKTNSKKLLTLAVVLVVAVAIAVVVVLTQSGGNEPEAAGQCTFSITCTGMVEGLDKLDENVAALVPEDGLLLPETETDFYDGETAFDVLKRLTEDNDIQMEYSGSGETAYIEGLGNIYEGDAGGYSGWMYLVNGDFAPVGCGAYTMQDGDQVEFQFYCDFGE